MSNKVILNSLKTIRENLRGLQEDSKRNMSNNTLIKRHVTIFVRESYLSMMEATLESIKENKIGSISVLVSLENYLIMAFTTSIIETEDFSNFFELMEINIKDLENKIKEQNSKILKVS
jgi:hypothetical protein